MAFHWWDESEPPWYAYLIMCKNDVQNLEHRQNLLSRCMLGKSLFMKLRLWTSTIHYPLSYIKVSRIYECLFSVVCINHQYLYLPMLCWLLVYLGYKFSIISAIKGIHPREMNGPGLQIRVRIWKLFYFSSKRVHATIHTAYPDTSNVGITWLFAYCKGDNFNIHIWV